MRSRRRRSWQVTHCRRSFWDFETISFAVPIWKGTRPYQQLTFQFSVHRLSEDGELAHRDFLDLSGGIRARRWRNR
jgi:hypothetical protein